MAEHDERNEDRAFEDLAAATDGPRHAPTRLKSRVYSALMRASAASGPLRPLAACEQEGRDLCVWERLARAASGGTLGGLNYCRVCHARVLGERVEGAPLAWHGCPYADFQK